MTRARHLLSSLALLLLATLSFSSNATQAVVGVGDPAPDFELQDSAGRTYRLSDYRGEKAVVLEFFRSGGW